ncbi:MAG: inositol monophosphatase family protein [Pseudomonadota bacterium]
MSNSLNTDETLDLMGRLCEAARSAIAPYFRNDPETTAKSGTVYDPVTVADRAAEQAMRDVLAAERPQDAILGEEFGETKGSSGWTWYLDPIDGTRAFVAGLPSWTTLIGLVDSNGQPVFGCVDAPAMGERYLGWPGGASLETAAGRSDVSVSACNDLREAIVSTTDPFILTASEQGAWTHIRHTARISRYGLDAYAYARLAGGTIDLVAESGLQPWDAAALVPVVRGAGGLALDWHGRPAGAGGGQLVCAASEGIMDQALLALRRSAE